MHKIEFSSARSSEVRNQTEVDQDDSSYAQVLRKSLHIEKSSKLVTTIRSKEKSLVQEIFNRKKGKTPRKYEETPYLNIQKHCNIQVQPKSKAKIISSMSKNFINQYKHTLTSLKDKKHQKSLSQASQQQKVLDNSLECSRVLNFQLTPSALASHKWHNNAALKRLISATNTSPELSNYISGDLTDHHYVGRKKLEFPLSFLRQSRKTSLAERRTEYTDAPGKSLLRQSVNSFEAGPSSRRKSSLSFIRRSGNSPSPVKHMPRSKSISLKTTMNSSNPLSPANKKESTKLRTGSQAFGEEETSYYVSKFMINNSEMKEEGNDSENVLQSLFLKKQKGKINEPPSSYFSVKPNLIGRAESIRSSRNARLPSSLKLTTTLQQAKKRPRNSHKPSFSLALTKPQTKVELSSQQKQEAIDQIILDTNISRSQKQKLAIEKNIQKREEMVDQYVHKVREIIEEKDLIFGCKPVVYREKLICSHDPDQALFVDFREKKKKQTNTIMKMLSVVIKRTLPTERRKVFEKKRAVPPTSGLIK